MSFVMPAPVIVTLTWICYCDLCDDVLWMWPCLCVTVTWVRECTLVMCLWVYYSRVWVWVLLWRMFVWPWRVFMNVTVMWVRVWCAFVFVILTTDECYECDRDVFCPCVCDRDRTWVWPLCVCVTVTFVVECDIAVCLLVWPCRVFVMWPRPCDVTVTDRVCVLSVWPWRVCVSVVVSSAHRTVKCVY